MFKRLIACLLTFCLVACGQASSPPATDFDTFIQESTVTLLDGTTHFNMQFLVNDCEALWRCQTNDLWCRFYDL